MCAVAIGCRKWDGRGHCHAPIWGNEKRTYTHATNGKHPYGCGFDVGVLLYGTHA